MYIFNASIYEKRISEIYKNDENYRANETRRKVVKKQSDEKISEELLIKNFAGVKYELNFNEQECNL